MKFRFRYTTYFISRKHVLPVIFWTIMPLFAPAHCMELRPILPKTDINLGGEIQFDSFNGGICSLDVCANYKNGLRKAELYGEANLYINHRSSAKFKIGFDFSVERTESSKERFQSRMLPFSPNHGNEENSSDLEYANFEYQFQTAEHGSTNFDFGKHAPRTNSFNTNISSIFSRSPSAFYDNRVDFFQPSLKESVGLGHQTTHSYTRVGFGIGKDSESQIDLDYEASVGLAKPGSPYQLGLATRRVSDYSSAETYESYGINFSYKHGPGYMTTLGVSSNDIGTYLSLSGEKYIRERCLVMVGATLFESDQSASSSLPEVNDLEFYFLQLQVLISDTISAFVEVNHLEDDSNEGLDDSIGIGFVYSL